jgi:hypothetical protein
MSGELKTDLRKQVSVPTALLLTALWLVPAFSGFGQLRGPKVTQETQLPQKLQRPAMVYVSDFGINPDDLQKGGPLRQRLNQGLLRSTMDQVQGKDSTPEGQAAAIVEKMSSAIITNLRNKGLSATRVGSTKAPGDGWIVQGRFSTVDEGDRAMRTAVGFGAGSTNLNVDVVLGEVVRGQEKPILLFDTGNSTGKGPGGVAIAAATKNPYALAVKYVMSGRNLETNIRKTAKLIADQIAKKARV